MSVTVGQGTAGIPTGVYPSSFHYWIAIDTTTGTPAGESVTITTASGSNPRIDTIVAYVNEGASFNTSPVNFPGGFTLAAVAGTPAGSPSAPSGATIQAAVGGSNPYIVLADVLVGTSVTQINSGNITDRRTFASISPANATGAAWAWSTWTPSWSNFTVGNGTVTPRFSQVGKSVTCALDVVLGSTSAVSGGIIFTLPVPAHSRYVAGSGSGRMTVASFYAEDFGVGGYELALSLTSTTTAQLYVQKTDGTFLYTGGTSASVPFAWGSTDFFGGTFTYEAA
jgi:hypothetical protein